MSTECGGVVTVEGELDIFSPNYPKNYPNSVNCTWLLKVSIIFFLFFSWNYTIPLSSKLCILFLSMCDSVEAAVSCKTNYFGDIWLIFEWNLCIKSQSHVSVYFGVFNTIIIV